MRALYKDLVVNRGKTLPVGAAGSGLPAALPGCRWRMLLPWSFGLTLPLPPLSARGQGRVVPTGVPAPFAPGRWCARYPGKPPCSACGWEGAMGWARPSPSPPGVGELPGRRGIGGSHPADFTRRGPSSPVCLRAGGNPLRPVGHHGPGRCGVVAGHFLDEAAFFGLVTALCPFLERGSPVPGFAAHRGGAVCPPGW